LGNWWLWFNNCSNPYFPCYCPHQFVAGIVMDIQIIVHDHFGDVMRKHWKKDICVSFLIVDMVFLAFMLQACQIRPITPSPPPTFTVTPEHQSGHIYYVDAQFGSDVNPGTQSKPWQTIQKAASEMSEGDTAIVLEGNYPERVFVVRPSLTFHAQGEVIMEGFSIQADYTTISGFTIVSLTDDIPTGIGIDVPSAGYCLIENNRFLYNIWGGVRLFGSTDDPDASHDCIVRNNIFFRNGMYAAEIRGQNHLIENNDVSHTIQHHPCTNSTADWLNANGFNYHGSGHIFRGNTIHDMPYGHKGFDTASCNLENLADLSKDYVSDSHTDCFQTYTGGDRSIGHDILFEDNRCILPPANEWVDFFGAKAFDGGAAYNLVIRNNLIIADLLSLFLDGCHDITFAHNTFIGSGDPGSQGLKFIGSTGNILIRNNVFYKQENSVGHIWTQNSPVDAVEAGFNCVYREGGSPSRLADPGDIWNLDPLLDSSYHLLPNSPCIDAGADLGITTDFDGNPRPQGNGFDIGAFEFASP